MIINKNLSKKKTIQTQKKNGIDFFNKISFLKLF